MDKKRNDSVCDGLTVDIFFKLVKSELLATPLDDGVAKSVTPDMMKELYVLSKKHDMAHMVAAALERHNLLGQDEISNKLRSGLYTAVWRDELKERELQQIYQLFEEEQIAFIPLKGAVIRDIIMSCPYIRQKMFIWNSTTISRSIWIMQTSFLNGYGNMRSRLWKRDASIG